MSERTVLICGAGIAGPTLAYWLARHGFRPTVVEHATAPRSSGSPVDVRGPAVDVAERMGVMPRIREARTHTTGIKRGSPVPATRIPLMGPYERNIATGIACSIDELADRCAGGKSAWSHSTSRLDLAARSVLR
jgi:2-polyprenyl-6-methoxyphenol hydroxylase-like FAD-dependent oxidoreductase